ncbi:MAG: alpha/beta hydrolase [Spirochaetaceae bacterium]|nr:MAG: alpha/beta hydrolase [Spirochaetaceae bacterium]
MERRLTSFGLVVMTVIGFLFVASLANHRIQLAREQATHKPPGQMVAVNGHRLHVYGEGVGQPTLVFLSGSGTTAPTYDFRGLYRRLSGDYRTVVVERAGYGWSDHSNASRDIATVLAETRTALRASGHEPPYVVFPHSMSGLEALYWATVYPDEVAAIVGLDPAVPPVYEVLPPPRLILTLVAFSARTGLLRLFPSLCRDTPPVTRGYVSAQEVDGYCAILFGRTMTNDMIEEILITQANAELVASHGFLDVPLLLFVSDGSDLAVPDWTELLIAYAKAAGGRYRLLDVSHYVHNLAAETIAADIRSFLHELAGE